MSPPKLPDQGLSGCFVIGFPAVVRVGIWNLFKVPAIAHIPFAKDTVGLKHPPTVVGR